MEAFAEMKNIMQKLMLRTFLGICSAYKLAVLHGTGSS
jgi:hypothetical protein